MAWVHATVRLCREKKRRPGIDTTSPPDHTRPGRVHRAVVAVDVVMAAVDTVLSHARRMVFFAVSAVLELNKRALVRL